MPHEKAFHDALMPVVEEKYNNGLGSCKLFPKEKYVKIVLTYGQKPRVGISNLPLDPSVLDALATEADLNNIGVETSNASSLQEDPSIPPPAVTAASPSAPQEDVSSAPSQQVATPAASTAAASTCDHDQVENAVTIVEKCNYPGCKVTNLELETCENIGESCQRRLHHMCQTDAEMQTWRGKYPGMNIENELKRVPPTPNPYQSTTDRICYRCHEHFDDIASILDPHYGLKPAAVDVGDPCLLLPYCSLLLHHKPTTNHKPYTIQQYPQHRWRILHHDITSLLTALSSLMLISAKSSSRSTSFCVCVACDTCSTRSTLGSRPLVSA